MSRKLGFASEVRRLATERDAVILAHNYQSPEVQDVADHVGDSLALARLAAGSSARTIVLAGVWVMAETAKVLCPERTVLTPSRDAGCSLADSCDGIELERYKMRHPGIYVVSYINCTAEVKALSDIICTSGNAEKVIAQVPPEAWTWIQRTMYVVVRTPGDPSSAGWGRHARGNSGGGAGGHSTDTA